MARPGSGTTVLTQPTSRGARRLASRTYHVCLVSLLVLLIGGCSLRLPPLMPTPEMLVESGRYDTSRVAANFRDPSAPLLYVTDRARLPKPKGVVPYGAARSASMAFGRVQLSLGTGVTWENLVAESVAPIRSTDLRYSVSNVTEEGRFPPSPYLIDVVDRKPVIRTEVKLEIAKQSTRFVEMLRDRLRLSRSKEIVLFVHGFNNTFDEAAAILAGFWHFSGRDTVPVLYSWPAAAGGLFGYFTDRESGEYTIFHLKEALRRIVQIDELKQLHIIAHSRGTDVITTAIRELIIESRHTPLAESEYRKLANLILAAPDIELGIIGQRLLSEGFGAFFDQVTIYTTPTDKALRLSQLFMKGIRIGRVSPDDISTLHSGVLEAVGTVNFVEIEGVRGFLDHGYFHSNPVVSSDIINLINHQMAPADPRRRLRRMSPNFWRLVGKKPVEEETKR